MNVTRLFRRRADPEARASVTAPRADATDALVSALERHAAGTSRAPGELALAEACVGLWERCLASATVAPDAAALRPLTPALLAVTGRMLASRGEACFAIAVTEADGAMLSPAASFDVRGGADAAAWRYRADLAGPSATDTRDLPAASVLHFRVGADAATPWRGRPPLTRAAVTAALASAIEASATADARLPVARLVPLAGATGDQLKEAREGLNEGGVRVLGSTFGAGGLAGEQTPAARFNPQRLGPDPGEAFRALRTDAGREICGAFGVPPALFEARGDGSGQREAWRRFWAGTVAPLGRLVQAELRAKLDGRAMVSFEAMRASDEDGRSRAVARRATAYKTMVDAGIEAGEARRLAGLEA